MKENENERGSKEIDEASPVRATKIGTGFMLGSVK
jgi:hypothetical protein